MVPQHEARFGAGIDNGIDNGIDHGIDTGIDHGVEFGLDAGTEALPTVRPGASSPAYDRLPAPPTPCGSPGLSYAPRRTWLAGSLTSMICNPHS